MDLNLVVKTLRQPLQDSGYRKHKIQVLAQSLPLVRNPKNLWVLVRELALSPGLFDGDDVNELAHITAYATDAIYACDERKHRISDPTLTPAKWEQVLADASFSVPPLVGLVVMCGLAAESPRLFAQQVPDFVCAVCMNDELVLPAAAAVSRVLLLPEQYAELPCRKLATTITRQLYNAQNLDLAGPDISHNLGRWSRLLKGVLRFSDLGVLHTYLLASQMFIRTVVVRDYTVDQLTPLLFGLLIQLEGVADLMLSAPHISRQQRVTIAINVLQILQPLGYVSSHVGTQFESYQFVFGACLDTLSMPPSEAAEALGILGEHWAYGQQLTGSEVGAGDLVFLFDVAEQLMPVLEVPAAEHGVLSIARRFIVPPSNAEHSSVFNSSVFESAHSVMLAFLAVHHSLRFSKRGMAVTYFTEVMQLFPGFLTGTQFRTAVLTVLTAFSPEDASRTFDQIFLAAKITLPGTPLVVSDKVKSLGPHASESPIDPPGDKLSGEPPTVRAALVSTLLHGVAQYCEAPQLARWLSFIAAMLPQAVSEDTRRERVYLLKDFSDIATTSGEVGVHWWFTNFEGRI